ncbi:hypothetical protein [Pannonibacter sp. SL95]|uniref:hypothetical protein n=1 Tax=Pannonibacter sp. SL95 TaxID=2995153 RepID=UPI002275326F|nr:hypothetical protein [Pannonibacter sp. SL95]MCY1706450.1 hypothetical protein [Pannonibacter sp. SL95]MCY1707347.1 hypothetical protein [Pannonibacter sp. SL95]
MNHFNRAWVLDDLARAIGLRVIGESIMDIAVALDRRHDDVAATLRRARNLCRNEYWVGPLLAPPQPAKAVEKRVPKARVLRRYTIRRDIDLDDLAAPACRDTTALLMGDPPPERRQLIDAERCLRTISLPKISAQKDISNEH